MRCVMKVIGRGPQMVKNSSSWFDGEESPLVLFDPCINRPLLLLLCCKLPAIGIISLGVWADEVGGAEIHER